jgi:DNA mismatch endonuclease, patch repair protein
MPKVPRFSGLTSSSPTASRTKGRNRARDSKAERLLRGQLWALGLRYRLHTKDLPGRPDIVFCSRRVAVFVDGDFWHGRDWQQRSRRLARGSNADYWTSKIAYNIERDEQNNRVLAKAGWTVLRLWETDIMNDPANAAHAVAEACRRFADGKKVPG